MRKNPVISIIIPVKNRIDLLKQTIFNLQRQSFSSFEIIVVDDHSTEDLSLIIDFDDDRIRVVESEGNGPGAARNTGLKIAQGKNIKFFDSDDLMTNNLLEDQLKTIETTNSDAVYGPFFMAKHQDQNWNCTEGIIQYSPFPAHKTLNQLLCQGFNIPVPCFLFKKEKIKDILWNEDIISSEDLDYLWQIGKTHQSFKHTNNSAFLYRIHNNQTMLDNHHFIAREKDKLSVLMSWYNEIESDKSYKRIDKLLLGSMINQCFKSLTKKEIDRLPNKFNHSKYQIIKKLQHYIWAIQRNKNKTLWPSMRGASNSSKLFHIYIAMIN